MLNLDYPVRHPTAFKSADSLSMIARDLDTTYERLGILVMFLAESGRRGEAVAASHLAAAVLSVSYRVARLEARS